jgi:hypothetical protein
MEDNNREQKETISQQKETISQQIVRILYADTSNSEEHATIINEVVQHLENDLMRTVEQRSRNKEEAQEALDFFNKRIFTKGINLKEA